MTTNEARDALYKQFLNNWAPVPAVPVVFENEKAKKEDVPEYVYVSVKHAGGGQETMGPVGSRKFIRRGVVFVQIYGPLDGGLKRFDELGKMARDIFEAKNISGVQTNDGEYREPIPYSGKQRAQVTVSFWYEEQK